jgi:hypothetical protein
MFFCIFHLIPNPNPSPKKKQEEAKKKIITNGFYGLTSDEIDIILSQSMASTSISE